jgi:hypothetical protein
MTGLNTLTISNLPLTDAVVPVLSSMKQLSTLNIGHTKLTADGIRRLRAALPRRSVTAGGIPGT